MTHRLDDAVVEGLLAGVETADRAVHAAWPGAPTTRQPVQVLYVAADRVRPSTARDAGLTAARLMDHHAPDVATFAAMMGLGSRAVAVDVRERVALKLDIEPVEDLRVDFEDGYRGGGSGDGGDAEDADAVTAGRALGQAVADDIAPPFCGLRVKSFTDGLARRSVRTLDRFLGALLETAGGLPDGFVVTFPKIVSVDHVKAFVEVLGALEGAHGLEEGSLGFEAQIETTASVLAPDGTVALRGIRDAGEGRLRAVHFGVFDYTAALGLPAEGQRLDHPACDFARHLMQLTFAGTEVRLADGSTNVRPQRETDSELHRVWRRHSTHVAHSLAHGYVQGWDLHPAHLVSRYAAVFAHLLTGLDDIVARLVAWHRSAEGAGVMDEPATITALERHVRLAITSGAIDPDDLPHPNPLRGAHHLRGLSPSPRERGGR